MATQKKEVDDRVVVVKDARLSFPHLFTAQKRENDDGTTRENFNCVLMVPKDGDHAKATMAKLKKAAQAAKKRAWGDDESKWPKIPASKTCVKDGDNEDHFDTPRDEYADYFIIPCASPVDKPPRVLTNRKDTDDKWIDAEPGKKGAPYAGCYVNAIIELYGQKKDPKRSMPNRINASVQTVQFRRDGDPFAAQPVDPNDMLDDDDVSYEGELDDDGRDDGDDDGDDGLI